MNKADAAINEGHECVVLSAMMNGSDNLPLTEDDFASPPNRTIYRFLTSVKKRGLLAVQSELERHGQLVAVGGKARLTDISCLPHDPVSVEYALGEVQDASRQRQMAKIGEQMRKGELTPEQAQEKLAALIETKANTIEREPVDDFPEPIGEAAFYGLADDIVRRIEPHTEADCVALLIQILVAFGNVIGRSPHALADGARHAMNFFAVLVGETSKARKGTAWAHVRRLFKRADEPWAQDCIADGLSSGEGVTWAVRDPITRSVKNKKSGKYEDEISDAGSEDKRLCVVEGEFANVLKVMTREGNTLSPVIRSAWDSGNLRSITKNSPARATGAHVSIIGHITKDELRRLLTETESANGFANRFLMLAVRRSKCLPEGGNIRSDSMNDLVTRLQKAIEFCRHAGEVTRSDEARSLWARIYPELSKGKLGLLGAITARAEAQVLRLSVIYALLDCSSKVEVEHLNAALALWDYCERSASWIFSTPEENEQRKLVEFIQSRGGRVRIREVTQSFRPLKNKPVETKAALENLVAAGRGQWIETRGERGPATREFQLLQVSTSTGFTHSPSISPKPVDVDTPDSEKNEASAGPDTEAETLAADKSGVGRL